MLSELLERLASLVDWDRGRGRLTTVEPLRQYVLRQDPRATSRLALLLETRDPGAVSLLSRPTRGCLAEGLRFVLSRSAAGERTDRASFGVAAQVIGECHEAAIAKLLDGNTELERRMRTLAWAGLGCAAAMVTPGLGAQTIEREARGRGGILWWLSTAAVPAGVVAAAEAGAFVLILPEPRNDTPTRPGRILRAEGRVVVRRSDGRGASRRIELDTSAAWIQARLRGRPRGAWVEIEPPSGFAAVEPDFRASGVRALADRGGIAVLRVSTGADQLVVPSLIVPNSGHPVVERERRPTQTFSSEVEIMEEPRGKVVIHFPDEDSAADPAAHGGVLLVTNLSGRTAARPRGELERELSEVTAGSLPELVREARVRVEGSYAGLDGEPVSVSIPVEDESTFTPDGLTRGDPGLFRLYVASRTYEQLERHLAEKNRPSLTEEEVEHLRNTLRFLEESLSAEEPS